MERRLAAIVCADVAGYARMMGAEEAERAKQMGFGDLNRVLTLDDLAPGENIVFTATGITDGDLVRGVRFFGNNARTHSIVMHSQSGTVRFIESVHRLGARARRA